jgi:hypothetical protein
VRFQIFMMAILEMTLRGCCAVQSRRKSPKFQRCLLPLSSGLSEISGFHDGDSKGHSSWILRHILVVSQELADVLEVFTRSL